MRTGRAGCWRRSCWPPWRACWPAPAPESWLDEVCREPHDAHALRARGAGEPLHVDVKKMASNPEGGGWRAQGTACSIIARALAFHEGLGVTVGRVMTGKGPTYLSCALNTMPGELRAQVHPPPQLPRQNGKVKRMNRTLAQE